MEENKIGDDLICEVCGGAVTEKVAGYSKQHFEGHIFCYQCQKRKRETVSNETQQSTSTPTQPPAPVSAQSEKKSEESLFCVDCGAEVPSKTRDFSVNSFGKILCFECQDKLRAASNNRPPSTQAKSVPEDIPGIDPKHLMTLNGKTYIKHSGLLDKAHQIGLQSITTELISPVDSPTVIMKATVWMKYKNLGEDVFQNFSAYGDADDTNLNSQIKGAKVRMAETRAVNRALRFATNIGVCSTEELGKKGSNDDTDDSMENLI